MEPATAERADRPECADRADRPPLWPAILAVALVALALFGVVLLFAARNDMPLDSLTRDPVNTGGLRWETGFLYKISLLVWGAITVACFLGAAIRKGRSGASGLRTFLLASAVLTLVFALDDMFQFRAEINDHLGLSELAVFAVYAVVLCVFAVVFSSTVLRTEYPILAAAIGLFVAWLVLRQVNVGLAVEDGVRLVAQLVLLLYFFRTVAYGADGRRPIRR